MIKYLLIFGLFIYQGIFCMKTQDASQSNQYEILRYKMVEQQIKPRGIDDPRVLEAMRTVPRHLFVPESEQNAAYQDSPLPIGHRQTISQPYIVAYMTEKLNVKPDDRVLEIGTGCGYQAAVLSRLVDSVFTIEIVQPLCMEARETLNELDYDNIQVMCGDGYGGWPEKAPFDAIIMTAAAKKIPLPLLDQLSQNGTLVAPVGDFFQELVKVTKQGKQDFKTEKLIPVRFVPMTGKAEEK
ncbi:protein-L-isoaspartate(D-aspartate) O-methyltransferase [candidate division KSB1 bacterium]|nr:protein-L-isoaspartate(D-aspartate) O-methyltransferase [candidate division KSB1 bacterium]